MFKNKKGVIENLIPVIIGLVSLGLVLAIGFLIMGSVNSNATVAANANASAAVETTMQAADDIPGWLPIIVITIIGALLIGLVALFRQQR